MVPSPRADLLGRVPHRKPPSGALQAEIVVSANFASDGQSILILNPQGQVAQWTGADFQNRILWLEAGEEVYSSCFSDVGSYSADGKWFAIASSLGYARVWEAATWQEVVTLHGFLKGAHSVHFSADGKRLAVGSGDHEAVKLWDTESWQEVFTLEGQGTGYMGTWFSPDGNTVTWANQTGMLHVWQAPSWEEIKAAEATEKAEAKSP